MTPEPTPPSRWGFGAWDPRPKNWRNMGLSSIPSGICMPVGILTTLETEILTTAGMATLAAGAMVTRLGASVAGASLRLICEEGKAALPIARPPPIIRVQRMAARTRLAPLQELNEFT